MSDIVDIRGIERVAAFATCLTGFRSAVDDALVVLPMAINRGLDRLCALHERWRREFEHWDQEVQFLEAALEECRNSDAEFKNCGVIEQRLSYAKYMRDRAEERMQHAQMLIQKFRTEAEALASAVRSYRMKTEALVPPMIHHLIELCARARAVHPSGG